jgi:predicted RNase H-like HicB family nuclease
MSASTHTPHFGHDRDAVQLAPEDREFVATVAEFPSMSWLALDRVEALRGLKVLVEHVIEDMLTSGEHLPERG